MRHFIPQEYTISVPSCEALQNPENGHVNYTELPLTNGRYPLATTASFMCNERYTLNGSDSITCQASLNWSHQTLVCVQGDDMKVLFG